MDSVPHGAYGFGAARNLWIRRRTGPMDSAPYGAYGFGAARAGGRHLRFGVMSFWGSNVTWMALPFTTTVGVPVAPLGRPLLCAYF